MTIEEIKEKMKDDLREETKEAIIRNGDWKDVIQVIAEWLTIIEEVETIKQLKELAIDEIGYDDTDWMES